VTIIDSNTFNGCRSVTSCTIGSGVTNIGTYAFADCRSLTSITSNAVTAPEIQINTFQGIAENGTLYVPEDSTSYDTNWLSSEEYYLGYYSWNIEHTQPSGSGSGSGSGSDSGTDSGSGSGSGNG